MDDAPHRQLAGDLRRRIETGEYRPGTGFPPYRLIAGQFGVTPDTAYRAVELLRSEGLLVGRPRTRLTVAYAPAVRTLTDPDAAWPHELGEVTSGTCPASAALAPRLWVPEGTRLRWQCEERLDPDGRPAMLLTAWWRGRRLKGARTVCEVHSHAMTPGEAAALGLAAGTSALLVERTRLDAVGRPVQAADLVLPADRWRVVIRPTDLRVTR